MRDAIQNREAKMTKVALVLTVTLTMVVGVLIWKGDATPLSGTLESLAVLKGYSTVQNAG